MATLQELQAQLRAVQQQMAAPNPYASMGGADAARRAGAMNDDLSRQQFAIADQIRALRQSGGSGSGSDPVSEAQARIQALTEGRAQEIANDPYTTAALGYLQNVVGGQETPFSDQVQNSILARQADQTAAAESARRQQLMDQFASSGMSASDPAAQAALRELSARRQQSNNANLGDMLSNANVQNFNARMSGANQLAAVRGAQNAQVNQMNLAGAGYRAQTFQDVPTGGFSGGGGVQTGTIGYRPPQAQAAAQGATQAPAAASGNFAAQQRAAMAARARIPGSAVNPSAPDMSGWTTGQRAAFTGQSAPAKPSPAPTSARPAAVAGSTQYGPARPYTGSGRTSLLPWQIQQQQFRNTNPRLGPVAVRE